MDPHRHPQRQLRRTDQTLSDIARLLRARDAALRAVRDDFHSHGFIEVHTPARVRCPGLEPHLVALPAGGSYLATSPELHLKRLLADGAERIFELAHCFRGDEVGPWHRSEFLMLEWYEAGGDLGQEMQRAAGIVRRIAGALGRGDRSFRGCDLREAPETLTVREAFLRYADLDLAGLRGRERLSCALEERGLAPAADDDWDDLFARGLVDLVEPRLGRGRMTILTEYPASQCALARVRDDPEWPVALRAELYAAGVELANGFDELTDPAEQRRRHEADRAVRRRLGREVPPLDEEFLGALERGLPRCAGVALGWDRALAVALGAESLDETLPFPDIERRRG